MARKRRPLTEERRLTFGDVQIWRYEWDRKNKRVTKVMHMPSALKRLFELVTGLVVSDGALTKADTSDAVLRWASKTSDRRYQRTYGRGSPSAAALDVALTTLQLLCVRSGDGRPAAGLPPDTPRDASSSTPPNGDASQLAISGKRPGASPPSKRSSTHEDSADDGSGKIARG